MKTKDTLNENPPLAYKHLLPAGGTLMNEHARWVHLDKVKIGQCVKCKGLISVGWLFPDMKWYRDFCFGCNDFRKFIVTKNPACR